MSHMQMSTANLATVFGPVLLRESVAYDLMTESSLVADIIDIFIQNWAELL